MIELLFDISQRFGLEYDKENYVSIFISSDNDISKKIVSNLLIDVFTFKYLYFKAEGYPTNIEELKDELNAQVVSFEKGNVKRFSVKKYPSITYKIKIENISTVLEYWNSIIYEKRKIYIEKEANNIFERQLKGESVLINEAYKIGECTIENSPDAENQYSFIIIMKKMYIHRFMEVVDRLLWDI